MQEPNDLQKQQYARFKELFALGRKRYLEAGGDPRHSNGSLHGNDYLTTQERKELAQLGRKISGFYVKDGYANCQGRAWKLPENSPLLEENIEAK